MKQTVLDEFVKSRDDANYFISHYIKVTHPVRGLVPFKLYNFQEQIISDLESHRFTILRIM